MGSITAIDEATGRKFYLDDPDDLRDDEELTFILSLHGGGSVGHWQKAYFPAVDYKEQHRLVIATPSAATKEPSRRWEAEADDEHLRNIVEFVFDRYGVDRIRAFWLVGHSQGGMTSNRLLVENDYFKDRVDGWLSLSGGRIGALERPEGFGRPPTPGRPAPARLPRSERTPPDTDCSFIFTCGEHEMVTLREDSPWAEKYGAGPRVRLDDIVDEEPGQIYDTLSEGRSNPGWGLLPRPGTAEVYVYPGARDGRVIADVIRLDKGHTEGFEPRVTEALIGLLVSASGGKARNLAKAG
jgi:pimeloyl-ACP methyl ester carboxylesterase